MFFWPRIIACLLNKNCDFSLKCITSKKDHKNPEYGSCSIFQVLHAIALCDEQTEYNMLFTDCLYFPPLISFALVLIPL